MTSSVVYGANGAGKSNLIKAIAVMREMVLVSAKEQLLFGGHDVDLDPYRLDINSLKEPISFEATFILNGIRHQYGFTATRERVFEEWLHAYPKNHPQKLFERTPKDDDSSSWSFGTHMKGDKALLANATRRNALYLSVGAALNHATLTEIYNWFLHHLRPTGGGPGFWAGYSFTARQSKTDPKFKLKVEQLLADADFGISGLVIEDETIDVNERGTPRIEPWSTRLRIFTNHKMRNSDEITRFDLSNESSGTQRFFNLIGPVLEALEDGRLIIIDELDSSLHPLMVRKLVEVFNSTTTNPKGAQILFTTHDATLLDPELFRRDQIWFTEKDSLGQSHIYPLLEYSPRKGEALQKGYLAGRYGAIPILGDFKF